jgi:hypothetical protein
MTIGIVVVAFFASNVAGVPHVAMISTLGRTSSSAKGWSSSVLPLT